MKANKKIIPVLLSVVILLFSLTNCRLKENVLADMLGPESSSEAESSSETAEPSEAASLSETAASSEDEGELSNEDEEEFIEEEEPPDNSWPSDTPKNHGVDVSFLDDMRDAIEETEIRSVVIVKDGYLIDEYYKDGYDENSVFRLHSCTKSFTSALIGIAIDEGIIEGVDAKISEFLPQLSDSDDISKKEITIEQLLEHTSGIYWSEWSGGPMFGQLVRSDNWVNFVLMQPMAQKPGSAFNYTTGGSHLLSAILQEAAGETAYDYALTRIFQPLGMDSVKWSHDPQGITDGGNGIRMTARDAAKFGQLYLDKGRWKEQQIVPEEWVEESIQRQSAGSPGTGEYGYQWWLKPFGNAAYSTYFAMGFAGQYIFVVPELNLVTVITSRLADTYAPQYYFNDYIIAACG